MRWRDFHMKLWNFAIFLFIKKDTLAQVFSREFCEIFKNIFFTENLWTTASLILRCGFLLEGDAYLKPIVYVGWCLFRGNKVSDNKSFADYTLSKTADTKYIPKYKNSKMRPLVSHVRVKEVEFKDIQ